MAGQTALTLSQIEQKKKYRARRVRFGANSLNNDAGGLQTTRKNASRSQRDGGKNRRISARNPRFSRRRVKMFPPQASALAVISWCRNSSA
jgi:hypothetical protein